MLCVSLVQVNIARVFVDDRVSPGFHRLVRIHNCIWNANCVHAILIENLLKWGNVKLGVVGDNLVWPAEHYEVGLFFIGRLLILFLSITPCIRFLIWLGNLIVILAFDWMCLKVLSRASVVTLVHLPLRILTIWLISYVLTSKLCKSVVSQVCCF